MRYGRFSLLVPVIAVAACGVTLAQLPTYQRGKAPTEEEIRAWDSAGPAGKGLPPGSGTAQQGAPIYAQKCASCHGTNGEGRPGPRLVGGKGTIQALRGWPFATAIWNMIHKSMPQNRFEGDHIEGSLSTDDVYALTAFLLYRNDIIKETDVLDTQSLPKVQMPNRNGFLPAPWPEPEMKSYRARCPVGICP